MATAAQPSFGALLKHYRLAAGMTQEVLAARAGMSAQGISALERGVRQSPYPATLTLLADALGLAAPERAIFAAAARGRISGPPLAAGTPHEHFGAGMSEDAPRGERDATIPLVGREREMARLMAHLVAVDAPLLLLAGEPGIGKTRLLRETAAQAHAQGWSVLGAGCRRQRIHEPYAPLLDALERHLRQQTPARLRAALADCAWLVRLLPELADVVVAPAMTWSVPPEQERRLIFRAVGRFLANCAGPAGTLLVLDDLQWAGPDGLDLLATLVRAAGEGMPPLRVVGAYRQTEVQPGTPLAELLADLAREGLVERLMLKPLTPGHAEELAEVLLRAAAPEARPAADGEPHGDERGASDGRDAADERDVHASLARRIALRAGGVPFYLVSCAQGLRAGGMERDEAGGGALAAEMVPWSVAENIRQRAAALPALGRALLDALAIIGRPARGDLLMACAVQHSSDAPGDVLASLEAACQAGLLVEEGEDVYRFAHDLIREAIEADMGSGRRRLLHLRVAQALERVPGAPLVMELAEHYTRAGDTRQAITYLERAGELAATLFAHGEAERIYRDLAARLDHLERPLEAARARVRLGTALRLEARYDEALAVLAAAAQTYRAAGEREGLGTTLAEIGWVHAERGLPEAGIAALESYVASAPAEGLSDRALAAVALALARLYRVNGRYPEMLRAAEQASERAAAAHDALLHARAEKDRGTALLMLGRNVEGARVLEAAIPLVEAVGDLLTLTHALNNLSVVHETRGRLDLGRAALERAVAAAEQVGDPALIAFMITRRATSAFDTGEWTRARADYERALALVERVGQSWAHAYPLAGLGRLELLCGEREAGEAHLERARASAEQAGDVQALQGIQVTFAQPDLVAGRWAQVVDRLAPLLEGKSDESDTSALLPPLVWAYDALGQTERAGKLLARLRVLVEAGDSRLELVNLRRVEAALAARQGAWAEAEAAAVESLTMCREMGLIHSEVKALHLLAAVLRARGDVAGARARLEAARALCQQLGERLYAEHIERALADLAELELAAPAPGARAKKPRTTKTRTTKTRTMKVPATRQASRAPENAGR